MSFKYLFVFYFVCQCYLLNVSADVQVKEIHFKNSEGFHIDWSLLESRIKRPDKAIHFNVSTIKTTTGNGTQTTCYEKCGIEQKSSDVKRIVGGSSAQPNQYPWMVAMYIITLDSIKMRIFLCGASIIKSRYLLTAAHCLNHKGVKMILTLVGYYLIDPPLFPEITGQEQMILAKKAIIHKDFDPVLMRNDIGIVELESPIEFNEKIYPICLPKGNDISMVNDSIEGIVTGWGLIKIDDEYEQPSTLQSATVNLMNHSSCTSIPILGSLIADSMLCAIAPGRDACTGDSGGPLITVYNSTRSQYVQVGIVSWGVGCALPPYPGIYTQVSNYINWIQNVTADDNCLPFVN